MKRRSFLKNLVATAGVLAGGRWAGSIVALGEGTGAAVDAAAPAPVRPPGARDEAEFRARCIRCLRCADACPNQAIVPLDGRFGADVVSTPTIQARRQACMLCTGVEGDYLRCGEVCPTGALEKIGKTPEALQRGVRMGVAEIDLELCYSYNGWSCGACARACPFPDQAMRVGLWERPEIIASGCVGCGLCERACIRYPQAVRVRPRGAT